MITSTLRGYQIELVNNEWIYSDTKEATATNWDKRPCGHCGMDNTPEGHDACLGTLPGVMNACCGHGDDRGAYVQFLDGFSIYKKDSLSIMELLDKHKSEDSQ